MAFVYWDEESFSKILGINLGLKMVVEGENENEKKKVKAMENPVHSEVKKIIEQELENKNVDTQTEMKKSLSARQIFSRQNSRSRRGQAAPHLHV